MIPLKKEAALRPVCCRALVVGGVWNPLFPVMLATVPLGAHLPRKGAHVGQSEAACVHSLGFETTEEMGWVSMETALSSLGGGNGLAVSTEVLLAGQRRL